MANGKDNINNYATSFISFDEHIGNVYDSIGGYTGTVYNNPQRITGWNGKGYAMNFVSSLSNRVMFNGSMVSKGNRSFRFKVLVATKPNIVRIIFCTGSSSQYHHGDQISIRTDGKIAWHSCKKTTGSFNFVLQSKESICDNSWHDILFTIEGDVVSLYIDGKFDSSVISTNTSGVYEHSKNLLIGCGYDGNTSSFDWYFNGQLDQLEIYDRVISTMPDKYFVFHNNEYKYHDGTSWQITTATEENFIQYGMEQLSQITEAQWQELSDDISIVMWSDCEDKKYMNVVLERDTFTAKDIIGDEYDVLVLNSEQANPQQLLLDAVAYPQTMYPTGDIQLFGIKELKSVNVTAKGNGRIGISVDSGVTWSKLNGTTWETITDIADGMTFAEFNALTGEQLEALKGDNNTIRFAYYLTGDAEVDRIELRISMAGIPEFANKNDYDMSYDATTKTITYDIKKSGHYIVNYTNT